MSGRTIVANLYPPPSSGRDNALYLFADDPVLQLVEGKTFRRNEAQRAALVEKQPASLAGSIFGPTLTWAYREYIVHRLVSRDAEDEPLGNAVDVPVDASQRAGMLRSAELVGRRTRRDDQRLFLFNVIVALEWVPNQRYLRQLEWGFRRASDLLYDVSNGTMAFGQVVFADHRWMDCADIQITASNRTLPRSWVSALHEAEKYTPIRVGRGVWSRRARRAIVWDEPEAYRTLVHEWGHYALELRDEYLTKTAAVDCGAGAGLEHMIVVPAQRVPSESIMATPDGNSELSNPLALSDRRFPGLKIPQGQFPGPGRLPLPFPAYVRLGELETADAEERVIYPPRAIPLDDTDALRDEWVAYVLRQDEDGAVERIVAQGVLDGTAGSQGFTLLGARPNDRVVLSGSSSQTGPTVFQGVLQQEHEAVDWHAEQPSRHFVAVQPLSYPRGEERRFVEITLSGQERKADLAVYPTGRGPQSAKRRGAVTLPTLDGHLFLELDGVPLIMPFSQGGSPWTTVAVSTNPIPAGSSDGDLLLFFSTDADTSEELRRSYADVRVVTTTLVGLADYLPNGARAISKPFGVASNARLDPDLTPTAVLFFDPAAVPANHELQVYRLAADGDTAQQLPTCAPQGVGYAAVPLAARIGGADGNEYVGGTLLKRGDVGNRVEYFRLFVNNVEHAAVYVRHLANNAHQQALDRCVCHPDIV